MENNKSAIAQFLGYFFRSKAEQTGKGDFNLKAMHTINKISILVFIAAVLFYAYRRLG